MDGYIKKSEAVDVIVKYPYEIAGKTATAIKMIEDLPSADVVPKSEVESIITLNSQLEAEVFEQRKEIERLKKSIFPSYCQACSEDEAIKIGKEYGKAEVASEIFAEIESLIDGKFSINHGVVLMSKKDFAKLKKKYTEIEVEN